MTGDLRHQYRDRLVSIIDEILATQSAALDAARDAVAEALAADKRIHVAGSGHSHLVALEAFYRAGGIAAAQALFDEDLMLHRGATRSTLLEREGGRAEAVLERYAVEAGDVVFIVSNSGRNAYPIELALGAVERRATTIAITSLRHARLVTSRHASGKRLFEIADIVLDNGGDYGDSALDIPGAEARMAPTSTATGVFLLNAVLAEAVATLAARGVPVDIYQSANTETAGPTAEEIVERWRDRIVGL